MKFTLCSIVLLVGVCSALPAFPKKFDKAVHGIGKDASSYGVYKKKFEYPLKAPFQVNSYNSFSGKPEDLMTPPDVPAYITSDGEAHEEMAPPQEGGKTNDDVSSYISYEGEKLDSMKPPKESSYSVVSPNSDGSDAMSALSFMVSALPVDSSYSNYWAETNPQKMLPPKELPESTYLAYPDEAKSEKLEVPSSEPKKEKTISSYSSYA